MLQDIILLIMKKIFDFDSKSLIFCATLCPNNWNCNWLYLYWLNTHLIFLPYVWWLVIVTLVVGLAFPPNILGLWWGPTNTICHFVNIDRVVIIIEGGRDTSTLHVIKFVWTVCTEKWWGFKKPSLAPCTPFCVSHSFVPFHTLHAHSCPCARSCPSAS